MKYRECDKCNRRMADYDSNLHRFSGEIKKGLIVNFEIGLSHDLDLCRNCLREIIYRDI